MRLCEADLQTQLTRRRPGQSKLTTGRDEKDRVKILSGVEFGFTLGTPIALFVANEDHRPGDYSDMADIPRPSHADYTYQVKYGVRASSGGGRASARETIGRVAAGALAEKWLRERYGVEIVAWVSQVHNVRASRDYERDTKLTRDIVDQNSVRCPDAEAAERMSAIIVDAKEKQDSVGGVVTCVCRSVPSGLGEPCFDKLEALLAHAMLSIPATKGFEIGSGFDGTIIGLGMYGSEHNDAFVRSDDKGDNDGGDAAEEQKKDNESVRLATKTNHSGGVQGGISNGQDIVIRVLFKPPATIGQQQSTVDFSGQDVTLAAKGRHDPCVVPRAVPIVEAMAALVLADTALQQEARTAASSGYELIGKARAKKDDQEEAK